MTKVAEATFGSRPPKPLEARCLSRQLVRSCRQRRKRVSALLVNNHLQDIARGHGVAVSTAVGTTAPGRTFNRARDGFRRTAQLPLSSMISIRFGSPTGTIESPFARPARDISVIT